MAVRFYRRIPIFPGIWLNVGRSGFSLTIGFRGFRYTIGGKDRQQVTVGLPGTGLSYSKRLKKRQTENRKENGHGKTPVTEE